MLGLGDQCALDTTTDEATTDEATTDEVEYGSP